jgi:hypothetical protein
MPPRSAIARTTHQSRQTGRPSSYPLRQSYAEPSLQLEIDPITLQNGKHDTTDRQREKDKKKIDGPLQMVKIVSVFPSCHGPDAVLA